MKLTIGMRVQKHRHALREAGLRPIQLWVPDTRRKDFAAECQRQSLVLKNDPQEHQILKEINSSLDRSGWI